jgi:hypothetical protein
MDATGCGRVTRKGVRRRKDIPSGVGVGEVAMVKEDAATSVSR